MLHPHAHHQTSEYKQLISRIREFFEAKKIPVYAEPPGALFELCPQKQKKTKKVMINALTLEFPQLTYCYLKEMRNKNKYYIKLFEAVAVAAYRDQLN